MCNCINIEIGSYNNQIQIDNIPAHMKAYKSTTGGHPTAICLDKCIAEEVLELWRLGITTTGCCCGHNKQEPFIGVIDSDIEKMKEMGYKVQINPHRPTDEDTFNSLSISKSIHA